MTNKQKALEISAKHKIDYRVYMKNHPVVVPSDSECFGSAMEMAEWKDQQFRGIIAQVRKWLDEQGKLDQLDLVEFDMKMEKLFKEEQQ